MSVIPRRYVAYLLFALALPSVASALPVVAGFGDSITVEPSYPTLLADYLDPDPIIDDNGVSSDLTSAVLSRLDTWIGDGNTADVLVLFSGTPDMYQAGGTGPTIRCGPSGTSRT